MINGKINRTHGLFITETDMWVIAHTYHSNHQVTLLPMELSILFMSFENLFKIRPEGVLSKYKFMGAFHVFWSICSCNILEVRIVEKLIIKKIIVIHVVDPNG